MSVLNQNCTQLFFQWLAKVLSSNKKVKSLTGQSAVSTDQGAARLEPLNKVNFWNKE